MGGKQRRKKELLKKQENEQSNTEQYENGSETLSRDHIAEDDAMRENDFDNSRTKSKNDTNGIMDLNDIDRDSNDGGLEVLDIEESVNSNSAMNINKGDNVKSGINSSEADREFPDSKPLDNISRQKSHNDENQTNNCNDSTIPGSKRKQNGLIANNMKDNPKFKCDGTNDKEGSVTGNGKSKAKHKAATTKNKDNDESGVSHNKNKTHSKDKSMSAKSKYDKTVDNNEDDIEEASDTLFPVHFEWVLFILTLTFRLWYVSDPLNWWIVHPDEIYQTMEVAHSEVYGYGFLAYEYLPPPSSGWENVTSPLREFEINKGMYSLRSFLLPKILAIVMSAARVVVPEMSPFLVIKLFHVMLTSLLPLAVYRFSLAHRRSRDSALMAAIFVCSSTTLNVFGTHTLYNSFMAPVVFYASVPLIEAIKYKDKKSPHNLNKLSEDTVCYQNGHSNGIHATPNYSRSKTYIQTSNGYTNVTNGYVNGFHVDNEYIRNFDLNGNSLKQRIISRGKDSGHKNGYYKLGKNGFSNGNTNGKVYLVNCTKTQVNGNISVAGKEAPVTSTKSSIPLTSNICQVPLKSFILGIAMSLCVYMRPDCAILPVLSLLVGVPTIVVNLKQCLLQLKYYIFGFVTGALIGGYDDHVMYGEWFISPEQWFRFNVWQQGASDVFGTQSSSFYLEQMTNLEPLTLFVCFTGLFYIVVTLITQASKSNDKNQNSVPIIFMLFLVLYSLLGHKEYRFFHNGIVLMYIAFSESLLRVANVLLRLVKNQKVAFRTHFIYIFIAIFTSSHIYSFLSIRDSSMSNWTYGSNTASNEVNVCLDFLRRTDDVTGVYVQQDIYMFGGYTVLHKNVSIIAHNHQDIFEYSKNDRVSIIDPYGNQKSLTLFAKLSEFISTKNTPYFAKQIIRNIQYNYLIVPRENDFLPTGYSKVFGVGNTKVLKRTFYKKEEKELHKLSERIPVGTNATVLEYEGYWLFMFGQYQKAEKRLIISNRLDPKRIGPFQLLRNIFSRKGDTENLINVMKACFQVYSQKKCKRSYTPTEIY